MIKFIPHLFILGLVALTPSWAQGQTSQDHPIDQDVASASNPASSLEDWYFDLPTGGRVWISENPSLTSTVLNVSASSISALTSDGTQLVDSVRFVAYTNYDAFMERAEVLVFRGRDQGLGQPLVSLPVEPGLTMEIIWDGTLPASHGLREGDDLLYLIRAYGRHGEVDETHPRRIDLVSEQQYQQSRSGNRSRSAVEARNPDAVRGEGSEAFASVTDAAQAAYGQNGLRLQNISPHGSSVRVQGQALPDEVRRVLVNGRSVPIDQSHRFVAEYLLPIGEHVFQVKIEGEGIDVERTLTIDLAGDHFFAVGIADVTVSQNSIGGSSAESLENDPRFDDDILAEGRLAFYLKAKLGGKFRITAHADTREEELEHLFDGFLDKNPRDLFRRLDPDRYYPVYGDDGTVYRDVDTQGKLYARVNWDKSEAIWGNYTTDLSGNEMALYQRGLYGAALKYKFPRSTRWGESRVQLTAFGSDAQTVYGHNEFVSTGGSVYYLRHTDVLPGSEQVVVELRDTVTGLTERRISLRPDVDYEFDHLQGRLILRKSIDQIVLDGQYGIIRDTPQPNLRNVLLIDYEYIPGGFNPDNMTYGVRGKGWMNDYVAVGGTYVNEGRGDDADYQLIGADITVQGGERTYIKVEGAKSRQSQAQVFFSDNGGMTFEETIPEGVASENREGGAFSIEGRINLEELSLVDRDYFQRDHWDFASWYKERDADFSVARQDFGADITEWGMELNGEINDRFRMNTRVTKQTVTYPVSSGATELNPVPGSAGRHLLQAQLIGNYRFSRNHGLTAELRESQEAESGGLVNEAGLGALRYDLRLDNGLELYGIGQATLWSGAAYEKNDRITGGGRFLWGDRTTFGGEYSHGSRGDAFNVRVDHRFTNDYSVYGRYGWSSDDTRSLFGPSQLNGFSIGQRWRATDRLQVFHETQQTKSGSETGLGHSLGLDFLPTEHWRLGLRVQGASLEAQSGGVDRYAGTLTAGYRDTRTSWSGAFEYRDDSGAEERTQLVTTQRFTHKINDSWRIAARLNIADTDDANARAYDARFIEGNVGFALRPWNSTNWTLLGKYTYLYDRQSFGQVEDVPGNFSFDQRSHVASAEGIYQVHPKVELSAKAALRIGEIRSRLSEGDWFASTTQFGALQARYHLWNNWDVLVEGRWRRNVEADDSRVGALVSIQRRITDFLSIGAGYNFTDFSDNLTDLDYNDKGWFINLVGVY